MITKEVRFRFSGLTRIIFSALLLALALSSSACSGSSGSSGSATSTGVTGSAQ